MVLLENGSSAYKINYKMVLEIFEIGAGKSSLEKKGNTFVPNKWASYVLISCRLTYGKINLIETWSSVNTDHEPMKSNRMVLVLLEIGARKSSLEKLCPVMNMPKTMSDDAYACKQNKKCTRTGSIIEYEKRRQERA